MAGIEAARGDGMGNTAAGAKIHVDTLVMPLINYVIARCDKCKRIRDFYKADSVAERLGAVGVIMNWGGWGNSVYIEGGVVLRKEPLVEIL